MVLLGVWSYQYIYPDCYLCKVFKYILSIHRHDGCRLLFSRGSTLVVHTTALSNYSPLHLRHLRHSLIGALRRLEDRQQQLTEAAGSCICHIGYINWSFRAVYQGCE